MYTYTRQDVAELLGISTRSVDRYIKAGKLRAKKEGKIVYVNNEDVKNLGGTGEVKHEIIDKKEYEESKKEKQQQEEKNIEVVEKKELPKSKEIEVKTNFKTYPLDEVYYDLRNEIKQKDEVIQDLSIKLGRAEEIVKNSVSMIDFKRSQMLLEDSKTHLGSAISDLKTKNEDLEKKLKYEKTTNWILIITVIVLLTIAGAVWFMNI
ncbi:helix-turn-helix domain-containing protein [Candidatus Gracilibacteria bacterium]|nr:helix-turn-helix domain-containing protein [Candidatus Gracilibacteria bacterium]